MESGKKIAFGVTAVLLLAVAVRVGLIYKANHDPGPTKPEAPLVKTNPDYLVFLKKERPDSLADQRTLIGKTVWVQAGGELDYYIDKGRHVDYSKRVDTLPGAEEMLIHEVFEEKAPTTGRAVMRIAPGDRQVLLGFTLPQSSDPKQMYAVPVGYHDDSGYTFYNDNIFYYDDPHQLYAHWGPQVWAHIDKHEAALGMSENQVAMALGQVATPQGDTVGNRTVVYDNDGHPMSVEFENDKAVKITPVS